MSPQRSSNLLAPLFLAFLASTTAPAQSPAGPNRPIAVPDEYVITPFGYFHPSCVRQLAEGDTLLEDGPAIQHADGAIQNLPACEYPHYTSRGEIVLEAPPALGPQYITHSWIEAATATTTTSYGQLAATWSVPPAPPSNDNQTVFFFPGFEQAGDVSTTILQPVLGWNRDFAGAWGMASWNCCPSGITTESTPVSVNSGDSIKGTIRDTCSAGTLSCPTWTVTTTDVTQGKSTTLKNTSSAGHTFNWAFAGVLEVYAIDQCSDYPPNGQITFSAVALEDDNFNPISNPNWSMTNFSSGQTPQCGYGVQVTPKQVTLDYATLYTLHTFSGSDGQTPYGGLIQAGNGNLYGTTFAGGSQNEGTVFKVTPSGALTTLYSFCAQGHPCPDGANPYAGLAQAGGNFYGTTSSGGAYGYGTVFKITPGGTLTTLYNFCSNGYPCLDGAYPWSGLVLAKNGSLYGTTMNGGTSNFGTVYKITPGGALTTLYSFCTKPRCADGQGSVAGLTQASDGNLYGTANYGGKYGEGSVYRVTPGGSLATIYSFCAKAGCPDGENPVAGLVQANDGNLYGTTWAGGAYNAGTLFSIGLGGGLTTQYNFCSQGGSACTDGKNPYAALVQASDGYLYGTTSAAGENGSGGTIFKFIPVALTTLYSFCSQTGCTDGLAPYAGLIQASDGNFYGTTTGGGAGTVFRLSVGLF